MERGENFWNFVFFIRLDWSDRLEMRVNSVEHWFSNLGTLFYFPLFELSVPVDGEFRGQFHNFKKVDDNKDNFNYGLMSDDDILINNMHFKI